MDKSIIVINVRATEDISPFARNECESDESGNENNSDLKNKHNGRKEFLFLF